MRNFFVPDSPGWGLVLLAFLVVVACKPVPDTPAEWEKNEAAGREIQNIISQSDPPYRPEPGKFGGLDLVYLELELLNGLLHAPPEAVKFTLDSIYARFMYPREKIPKLLRGGKVLEEARQVLKQKQWLARKLRRARREADGKKIQIPFRVPVHLK